MPFVVFVLAAAVFAQGTSEFMLSGMLADIAADSGVSLGEAGLLTSVFAVGMVIGAPTMAMAASAVPRRVALMGFLALFALCHVVGAMTANFAVLLGTRLVAAVANAGFLAVVLASLPTLVRPPLVGRATAVILSGVTIACIAGVPAGTVVGQLWGWQSAFWAIAALSALALVVLWPTTSALARRGGSSAPVWTEWRVLAQRRLLVVIGLGVLVNAATFAGFTYLGTITTAVSAPGSAWVPAALALFGIGSFLGVTIAGRCSDRYARRIITGGAVVVTALWVLAALSAHTLPGVLVLALVTGAGSFGVGSTVIASIVSSASATAPRIAGALATTAFNLGAIAGPAAAGLAVGDAAQAHRAFWISAVFGAAATLVAALAARRSSAARAEEAAAA
ncbi:MFS transporter, DHA1 family, chloramphenicol resistance protein [Saccharopolyspora antimicrobica]|uniref:DHA1 family chloramphenicol resistance protein-like MFS transporter n=1 Tax=Saccharopolyspora antimicrobica TaxID=455193 RepID=A0A1I4U8Z8_9PSEU|nr:DHA1 family chloramphenicol resistance protein-like MFS transporter [Saccharopolyspora antimicrobica]SFM85424.1 MFS transporter, DHA1 family, chloramphenicol resistance protein [Saccharopolyspora antimicrobica]